MTVKEMNEYFSSGGEKLKIRTVGLIREDYLITVNSTYTINYKRNEVLDEYAQKVEELKSKYIIYLVKEYVENLETKLHLIDIKNCMDV